jgi:hypothetical protein
MMLAMVFHLYANGVMSSRLHGDQRRRDDHVRNPELLHELLDARKPVRDGAKAAHLPVVLGYRNSDGVGVNIETCATIGAVTSF